MSRVRKDEERTGNIMIPDGAGQGIATKIFRPAKKTEDEKSLRKRRVAAYCRVSSELESQEMSFEMQVRVYTEKIQANPDWTLVGIYADEGVTGTSAARRVQFMQMISDCESGKIDCIITKSISRFARNTLECLGYIRQLQGMGIQILFEKEGIDTGSSYSEMILTILAAFSQEESRSISENVKWSIRKRYEEGIDRWAKIYGYMSDGERTYVIVEDEAKVVRRVFFACEQGKSTKQIAEELNRDGIPTPGGGASWDSSVIFRMLKNEKYCGDILLQKKYTESHLSHHEVKNDFSEIPAYYIREHHAPIIERKQFERCRNILEMNSRGGVKKGRHANLTYPFGDYIRCPVCGKSMKQKKIPVGSQQKGWVCAAGHFVMRSDRVEQAVLEAYRTFDIGRIRDRKDEASAVLKAYKRRTEAFERVDYYWVDDLIDAVTFGLHSGYERRMAPVMKVEEAEDHRVYVHWKCGLMSSVPSGLRRVSEMPAYLVEKWRGKEKKEGHSDGTQSRRPAWTGENTNENYEDCARA
ncbi:MAG: recombinase family protein [Roseburia sp.]|nr:recombinase family protein [Roseburia sp.]